MKNVERPTSNVERMEQGSVRAGVENETFLPRLERSMFDVHAVTVAIAIVKHDDKFLIGRRPAGVPLAGYWEFPGGKVRRGESPEQAAARECREETGLQVQVSGEFPSSIYQYDHGPVELHFFRCLCLGKTREPMKPFRWVPRADLAKYRFPEGNHELLKKLSRCTRDRL